MDLRTAQALIRFGLGRRGEEPLPADPATWLTDQLRDPDPTRPTATTERAFEALRFDRQNKPPPGERRGPVIYREDARAALTAALVTPAPFRERLVWFWTNHFTVSARGGAAALCGAFVAEAIRPHVTGRFEDMLLAVMHHPAMLIYLNNARSVGPDSRVGRRRHRGLNENLARECLELHTLGAADAYSQADVTNFAQILTGWSINRRADPPGFMFRRFAHEPGSITLMDRPFPPGEEGGIEALRFLANHPSTHRSLARKLVQHFVTDTPSPADAGAIEAVLRDTGGNLGAAAAAVVRLDTAWQPASKLRAPQDYAIAGLRMFAPSPDEMEQINAVGMLAGLGQPLWNAPQPDGWPDRAASWAGPEGMMRRIDWAYRVAGRVGERDPGAMAHASLGPLLRPATWTAVMRAGSRRDAVTLLLTSPEFQRR